MLQRNPTCYFHSKFRLFFVRNWVLLYMSENTKHCPQLSRSTYSLARPVLSCAHNYYAGCEDNRFSLAPRHWGRLARRNVCNSATEIPY